jgi:hypothetical protein
MGNIKFEGSPPYALPIAQNVTARAEGAVVEMTLDVITPGKEPSIVPIKVQMTSGRRATGELGGDPRSRFAATLSLPRSDRHVVGADLNRSASPAPHSPPHEIWLRPAREDDSPTRLPPRVQAPRGHCVRVEKVALSLRGDHQLAQVDKNQARAAREAGGGRGEGHAYAGLLFKLATPPRQHRARR